MTTWSREDALAAPMAYGWRFYKQQVVPVWAPTAQKVEARRAFYAGARTALDTLGMMDGLPDAERARVLAVMRRELDVFLEQINTGNE